MRMRYVLLVVIACAVAMGVAATRVNLSPDAGLTPDDILRDVQEKFETFGSAAVASVVVAAIATVATLARPGFGLGLMLAEFLPLSILSNLGFVNSNAITYCWVIVTLVVLTVRRPTPGVRRPSLLAAVIYIGYVFLESLRSEEPYLALVLFLRAFSMMAALYAIVPRLRLEEYRQALLLGVVGSVLSGAIVLFTGLMAVDVERLGKHWGLNPNALGHGMVMPLLFCLDVIVREDARRYYAWIFSLAILGFCIVLTGSRGAMLATVLSTLVVAPPLRGRSWVLLVILPMLVAVFMGLTESKHLAALDRVAEVLTRDADVERVTSGRASLAEVALDVFRQAPVLGIGSRNFENMTERMGIVSSKDRLGLNTHNIVFTVLCEQGALGFFLFLLWLLALARVAAYARPVSRFPLGALVAFVILGVSAGYNLTAEYGFMLGGAFLMSPVRQRALAPLPAGGVA